MLMSLYKREKQTPHRLYLYLTDEWNMNKPKDPSMFFQFLIPTNYK